MNRLNRLISEARQGGSLSGLFRLQEAGGMTAGVTPCTNILIGDFGQPSPCRGVHPLHPLRADFQTRCFYGFEQFRSERRPRARARSGTCSPEGSEQNSPPSFFESHPATLPAT